MISFPKGTREDGTPTMLDKEMVSNFPLARGKQRRDRGNRQAGGGYPTRTQETKAPRK